MQIGYKKPVLIDIIMISNNLMKTFNIRGNWHQLGSRICLVIFWFLVLLDMHKWFITDNGGTRKDKRD